MQIYICPSRSKKIIQSTVCQRTGQAFSCLQIPVDIKLLAYLFISSRAILSSYKQSIAELFNSMPVYVLRYNEFPPTIQSRGVNSLLFPQLSLSCTLEFVHCLTINLFSNLFNKIENENPAVPLIGLTDSPNFDVFFLKV